MKNECYIVRDLLPSYIDQLCSEESKQFIEQHIVHCDSCARILDEMKEEFHVAEQVEMPVYIEQKKPFEKVSKFLKAQLDFAKFLKVSFWLSLSITIVLLVMAFSDLKTWQENQQEEQRVEQQQQEIMRKAFATISAGENPDATALQEVLKEYQKELQHIAVFSAEYAGDNSGWQDQPTPTYPIDYEKASIVVGENGVISDTIVPNDYDIGTMIMAKDKWVIQFEYKESYLETVENAFQIKNYSPDFWQLFIVPTMFILITLFLFFSWIYQKRIIRPIKNIVVN